MSGTNASHYVILCIIIQLTSQTVKPSYFYIYSMLLPLNEIKNNSLLSSDAQYLLAQCCFCAYFMLGIIVITLLRLYHLILIFMEYWYSPHFIDENTKKITREFNLHILNTFIGKFIPKCIGMSASEIHAPINPVSRLRSSGRQESPSNTYWMDNQWLIFWWPFTGTGRDKQVLHISCQMSPRMLSTSVHTATPYMDHLHQNYLEFFMKIHLSVLHGIRNSEAETQIFAFCKCPWKTKDHTHTHTDALLKLIGFC